MVQRYSARLCCAHINIIIVIIISSRSFRADCAIPFAGCCCENETTIACFCGCLLVLLPSLLQHIIHLCFSSFYFSQTHTDTHYRYTFICTRTHRSECIKYKYIHFSFFSVVHQSHYWEGFFFHCVYYLVAYSIGM